MNIYPQIVNFNSIAEINVDGVQLFGFINSFHFTRFIRHQIGIARTLHAFASNLELCLKCDIQKLIHPISILMRSQ